MIHTIIEDGIKYTYHVNKGSLKAINEFKQFVGEETFNQIEQGIPVVNVPLKEEKYKELLTIILQPEKIANDGSESDTKNPELHEIPYHHTEALVSFFCEPFAGRLLKQAKSMMDGISSMLSKLTPEQIKTLAQFTTSPNPSGQNTNFTH